MAISVRCEKCNKSFSVQERLAGQHILCPKCGGKVAVPGKSVGGGGPGFDPFEALLNGAPPAGGASAAVSGGSGGGKCKHCGKAMKGGSVICMSCGYNAATGQMIHTASVKGGSAGGTGGSPWLLMIGGGAVVVLVLMVAFFVFATRTSRPETATVPQLVTVQTVETEQAVAKQPEVAVAVTPEVHATPVSVEPAGPTQEELDRQRQLEEAKRAEEARLAELKRQQEEAAAAAAAKRAEHEAQVAAQRKDRLDVNQAIERGRAYLISQYQGEGKFGGPHEKQIGQTALVVYALLKSGVSDDEKCVAESINPLLAYGLGQPGMDSRGTYNAGLVMMALDLVREHAEAAIADQTVDIKIRRQAIINKPKCIAAIRRCVSGMYTNQKGNMSFSYGGGSAKSGHDMSIHQYALLGMWSAYRSDVVLRPNYWTEQTKYLLAVQNEDGGWGYRKPDKGDSTRAMTCAGISSLAICQANTSKKRITRQTTTLADDRGLQVTQAVDIAPATDVEKAIGRGFEWLAKNGLETFDPYYLYGLERASSLTATTTINNVNWYETLSKKIVQQQRGDGSWAWSDNLGGATCGTAWCVLFLRQSSLDYFNNEGEQQVDITHPNATGNDDGPPEAMPQPPAGNTPEEADPTEEPAAKQ